MGNAIFGSFGIGTAGAVNGVDDDYKKKQQYQPQVAFVNSVFDNFGGNSSGTEASFNA